MRMPILAYFLVVGTGSLRRIGIGKHSTGIKAAARVAKDWGSTAVQGIGR
jgi:hypothetical protein